jgi:hypothetical protein
VITNRLPDFSTWNFTPSHGLLSRWVFCNQVVVNSQTNAPSKALPAPNLKTTKSFMGSSDFAETRRVMRPGSAER